MNKGALHVVSTIMSNLMSYAAEAEVAALYLNAKYCVIIQNMFKEMVYTQPTTPVQTKNSTEEGIVNRTIVQKFSKAMDMHFYWMHDQ